MLWTPGSLNGAVGTAVPVGPVSGFSSYLPYVAGSLGINNYGQVSPVQGGNSPGIWTPGTANGTSGSIGNQVTGAQINGYGQALMGVPSSTQALFTPGSPNSAFGSTTVLPGLPGATTNAWWALGDSGVVAGQSCVGSDCRLARWTPNMPNGTTGVTAEIALPAGYQDAVPFSINRQGQMVGRMTRSGGTVVPFLVIGNTVYDLSLSSTLLVGGLAVGINDAGQILVQSTSNNAIYLLTPVAIQPPPPPNATAVTVGAASIQLGGGGVDVAFTVSGSGCQSGTYMTPQTLSWTPGATCSISFVSPFSNAVGLRQVFADWQDGASGNPRTFVAPGSAVTLTARFRAQSLLTTQVVPAGSGSVTAGGWFDVGTSTSVAATANAGYRFVGWSGGNEPSSNPLTVAMSYQPQTLVANFAEQTASPPSSYAVIRIAQGTLSSGRPLNNYGQVVGLGNGGPFLWTPSSANGPLGELQAFGGGAAQAMAINDRGQVAYTSGNGVMLWTPGSLNGAVGTAVPVGPVSGFSSYLPYVAGSLGINNYGQVSPVQGGNSPGIWTPGTANGTSGSIGNQVTGAQINGYGQALMGVPSSTQALFTPGSPNSAFGSTTVLPGLPGATTNAWWALGDSGVVAGQSCVGSDCRLARWTPNMPNGTTGVTAEIALPAGYQDAVPFSINRQGQMVGRMTRSGGTVVPFLVIGNTVYDLSLSSTLLVGGLAVGINDAGQILVQSTSNNAIYLLTPVAMIPANPVPIIVPVTVTSTPVGARFNIDGTTYTTPSTFLLHPGGTKVVTLDPVMPVSAGTRGVFQTWADGIGSTARVVTAGSAASTYTANYRTQHQLTLQVTPAAAGSIQTNPAAADGFFNQGETVTLTAVPSAGFSFNAFGLGLSGSANPQQLQVTGPVTIQANFTAAGNPVLAASIINAVSATAQPGPAVRANLQFRNSSSVAASEVTVTSLSTRVLVPVGQNVSLSTALPLRLGTVAAGGSSTVQAIDLSVPATVRRFLLEGAGTLRGPSGALVSFSFSTTIIR